jgi:peptide/nickel transport system substrate-binding protein
MRNGDKKRKSGRAILSRRQVLKITASGVLPMVASTLPSAVGLAQAQPKLGGQLRVAGQGGGAGESVDAAVVGGRSDIIRNSFHYDQLVQIGYDTKLRFVLAEQFERTGSSGDTWTVRLRPGVEFHNGKSLQAEDVLYTFQRIMDPATGANGRGRLAAFLNVKDIVILDKRTLRFHLLQPHQEFDLLLGDGHPYGIVPIGFDRNKPIGTGPFQLKSFTPGQQSVSVKFPNYWGPKAYVDELTFFTINDEAARVNALMSGQIDVLRQVPVSQIGALKSAGYTVLSSGSQLWLPFAMACDIPPFNDVRVRQALRLLADRKQMVEQALGGEGLVGNDLYGRYDQCFALDLMRPHDIDQARSLLKQAGQQNLQVELVAAPLFPGLTQAAQIFAQNAAQAGVTVNVRLVDNPTIFGPNYLKWPFSTSSWPGFNYLNSVAQSDGPGSVFNEAHFNDPEFESLYKQTVKEPDANTRCTMKHKLQEIQFERGGFIIWGYPDNVNAHNNRVAGFVPFDRPGFFQGGADLSQVYFTS